MIFGREKAKTKITKQGVRAILEHKVRLTPTLFKRGAIRIPARKQPLNALFEKKKVLQNVISSLKTNYTRENY